MSPTIPLKGRGAGKYAFRFFSSDVMEPPHVHVYRGDKRAKVWLVKLEVEWSRGYNQSELTEILRLIRESVAIIGGVE
ncbi:MAG: DUF4160 domain-containing protein [Chloroflexi bacterium]|nr:DUF4160 domain-containing protein [Chloroflexota bacterium]